MAFMCICVSVYDIYMYISATIIKENPWAGSRQLPESVCISDRSLRVVLDQMQNIVSGM